MSETIPENQIERPSFPQNRLNSKLKERLAYSGIYSRRDSAHFWENMAVFEQNKLFERLKLIYAQILFDYFATEAKINGQIDRFVEEAFFINLPLNKVVEIHIELIDNLERQLRFESLHTEHLSDYRLTLIDVLAHLGEMYRSVLN